MILCVHLRKPKDELILQLHWRAIWRSLHPEGIRILNHRALGASLLVTSTHLKYESANRQTNPKTIHWYHSKNAHHSMCGHNIKP